MKIGITACVILSFLCANGQAVEIFKPRNGEVLDYFLLGGILYIETTRGCYERLEHSVYYPTKCPEHEKVKREFDTITIKKGALNITHKSEYSREYFGHSVRYNDDRFIGTYSGVYSLGAKILQDPCSGNIRTHDDLTYICYGGLAILRKEKLVQLYRSEIDAEFVIAQKNLGVLNDIAFNESQWIVSTNRGLFIIDNSRITDTLYLQNETSNDKLCDGRFISDTESIIEGFISNIWFLYNKEKSEFKVLKTFASDVKNIDETKGRIVTTYDSIIILDGNKQLAIRNNLKLHGTFSSNSKLYGFSDDGLFLLNISYNTLEVSPIIFNEFNKHSLRIREDSIFIGSINGLWGFSASNMPEPIQVSKNPSQKNKLDDLIIYTWIISIILSIIIGIMIFLKSSKEKLRFEKYNSNLSKENILNFIESNLNTVTLISIQIEFKLSQKLLYEIFSPEKPGEVIRRIRLDKLEELYLSGKPINEIAKITGFSKDYILKYLLPQIKSNASM